MMKTIKSSYLILCRNFRTSPSMNFKFKLTEEMSKEFEEKQKAELAAKKPPELSLHIKENSLIMARVSSDRYNNIIKAAVPKHRFNDHLLLYIRENDDVKALDEKNLCKPGDWVLLRKIPNPVDKLVTHVVERVAYSYGNYIDPLTGRKTYGLDYEDDVKELEAIKIDI